MNRHTHPSYKEGEIAHCIESTFGTRGKAVFPNEGETFIRMQSTENEQV